LASFYFACIFTLELLKKKYFFRFKTSIKTIYKN